MLHLRETLTMPNNYYTDITDSASSSLKESMNARIIEYNASRGKSKMLESLSTRQITKALREAKIEDAIVQKVVNKLKEGGIDVNKQRIYRVPVARINPPGTVNGNHRRYPAKLWENVMNNQEDAWKGLCGLAEFILRMTVTQAALRTAVLYGLEWISTNRTTWYTVSVHS